MIKKTYLIRQDQTWPLVSYLTQQCGFPTHHEELVLYLEHPTALRLALDRRKLVFSWHPPKDVPQRYERSKYRITLDVRHVREALLFFAQTYGNRATASESIVLRFNIPESPIEVEVRERSLVGPIFTLRMPDRYFTDASERQRYETAFSSLRSYIVEGLADSIKSVPEMSEEFVSYGLGEEPILSSRIMDFCRRNGIFHAAGMSPTYREILEAKSNDYGIYEQFFRAVTGIPLLSIDKSATVPLHGWDQLSIVVPCFNSEGTVPRLLDSLASQAAPDEVFRRTEVLLVDDGSRTPLEGSLPDYRWPFAVRTLRLYPNGGVSLARLLGVSCSRGDILIFLDADLLLSRTYIADHLVRNVLIPNGVFVSFKENVDPTDQRLAPPKVEQGLPVPSYAHDLRLQKKVTPDTIGSYEVSRVTQYQLLAVTNYFKDFHGSRIFPPFDLSCMVTGHNFSCRRTTIERAAPFSASFKGWGMEDVYFGMRILASGNYIIPVLSCGVYHLDHPPRSGTTEAKKEEHRRNTELINSLMNSSIPDWRT